MGRNKLVANERMTYVIGFKVPNELLEKIKNACETTGETPGQFCRSVVMNYIK